MAQRTGIAIGLDLGTSSLKAIAVEIETGRVIERVRQPYPTHRPEQSAAEQAPRDWMAAVVGALGRLAAATRAADWVGIALSAMLPTMVRLDASGEPIGNAIVWEDNRAEPEARHLREHYPEATAYARTGQLMDGRYLVPMSARLARLDPASAERVARIVGAKDYVFAQLTGELLTDPSTAAGSGVYDLARGEYATGAWGALPTVAAATTLRGLHPGVARLVGTAPGIPVALGAADSVLGAEALGARPGHDIAIISGTSTVVLGLRETLALEPKNRALVTPLARGGYGFEMDLVATGSAFQWLAQLTGAASPAVLLEEAAPISLIEAPETLPFVGPGEQGALWDSALRGAFLGLTLGTTRGALMRGLITGVILELRRCVAVLAESPDARILVAGSSLSSELMLQDLADATGLQVAADRSDADHSALGAVGVLLDGLALPALPPITTFERFDPRPDRAVMWAELAARQETAIARERERVAGENAGERETS
ncbi:xylulokinase [Leucobacter luti]|uniref:xylulokinase n=1 Tax=Leucobacter luti TaxID=340320 RepID=UPI001051D73A|nr:FGGY-family carbohydrate kinase [Leucobacter luti]MCW2289914.1 xylulokinase [Leucobacter luti]TCK36083.1 xylulokinase [Leucobacter luti]